MKIQLNNNCTEYHIDTYGVFTQENELDVILDNMVEDGELPEHYDWDDYDVTYDHEGYVKELARRNTDFMEIQFDKSIIKSIELVDGSEYSPREYNFSTDGYLLDIEFDENKLDDFIAENDPDYMAYVKDRWTSRDGFISFMGADDYEVKLAFYLNSEFDFDDHYDYLTQDYPGMDFIEVTVKDKLKG